jgi:hypothetical protein
LPGKQRQRQKQIPFGDDKQNSKSKSNSGNCNGEIQGSLHFAADDETVRRFGRDDVSVEAIEMTYQLRPSR